MTFCVLLFGTAMYVLDNAEPESNTRNLLGQYAYEPSIDAILVSRQMASGLPSSP